MTGRDLKYKLEQAGYSLVEIASLIGISPQNLQNKLNSKDVKIGFLQNLAKAINKSIYYFIEGDANNAAPIAKKDRLKQESKTVKKNVKVNAETNGEPIHENKVIKEPKTVYSPGVVTVNSNRKPNIILVPVKAQAGYLCDYDDQEWIEKFEAYSVPDCTNGNFRMFEVDGYSMYPTLSPGDYVVGQAVTDFYDIMKDTIYVIVSQSEGIIIKRRLNANKMDKKIVFYSDNPDRSTFPLIEINHSDIVECWRFYKLITSTPKDMDPITRRIHFIESEINEIKRILMKK